MVDRGGDGTFSRSLSSSDGDFRFSERVLVDTCHAHVSYRWRTRDFSEELGAS